MRKIPIVFMALFFFANSTSAIECPKMPEQSKKDIDVQVNAAVGRIGPVKGAELETRTRAVTNDLMSKLPNADKAYLYQMMYATYCSSLRDDKTLSESEKRKRIESYNKELTKTLADSKNTQKKQSNSSQPPAMKFESQRKQIEKLIGSDDPKKKIEGISLLQEVTKTYPSEKQDLIDLLQKHLIKDFPQDKQIEQKYLPVLKHAIHTITTLPKYDENGFPLNIDLHQIRIENLDLTNTNFKDISLWGCQFYKVNFSRSSFINTDLGGVQFNECSLEYCKFEGAKITGSFMDKENDRPRPTRFIKTRLYGSDIEKAQIDFCELIGITDYPVDKLHKCRVRQF